MSITVNGIDELKKLAGSDLGTSEWIEVTQERINTFADATGEHKWIHVAPERAAEGPFGAPIAPGYLTPTATWLARQHPGQTTRRPGWQTLFATADLQIAQRITAQRATHLAGRHMRSGRAE